MTKIQSPTPTVKPRRILPTSQADLAELKGCSRATVCKLCKTRFAVARLPEGDYDRGHPVVREWLATPKRAVRLSKSLEPTRRNAISFAAVAREKSRQLGYQVTEAEVRAAAAPSGALEDAVLSPGEIVSQTTFAELCNVSVNEIRRAAKAELKPAITAGGDVDVDHIAALKYGAARPFRRNKSGEPIGVDGYLVPAMIDDDTVDAAHPIARLFFARIHGDLREVA